MSPVKFDGFVAGLLSCSERISPEEWIPLVLGSQKNLNLDSKESGQLILDTLITHFNNVAWNLMEKESPYQLINNKDDSDEVFWKSWLSGFFAVEKIKPQAFSLYNFADHDAKEAFSHIEKLYRLANDRSKTSQPNVVGVDGYAADTIPYLILHMYQWLEMNIVPNGPLTRVTWESISNNSKITTTYH